MFKSIRWYREFGDTMLRWSRKLIVSIICKIISIYNPIAINIIKFNGSYTRHVVSTNHIYCYKFELFNLKPVSFKTKNHLFNWF